jgi:hypothetical protein
LNFKFFWSEGLTFGLIKKNIEMKKIVLLIFLAFITVFAKAQEKEGELIYHVGAGPAIEGNHGMWGLNISNELSYFVHDRISINPSITFFNTIASFDHEPKVEKEYRQDHMSSLFTNVKLQIDLLKTSNDFRVGVAAGPTFQLGGSSYHRGFTTNESRELVSLGYEVEKHVRLGYITQVTFDWKNPNPNRRSSILVSMSSFDGYWPYYLMATYRLGFNLN